MTPSDMIMSSSNGLTFMYRAGGIAVYNERLLVEHDVKRGFCFVPGGRVNYGEKNAAEALAREVREELARRPRSGASFSSPTTCSSSMACATRRLPSTS